MNEWLARRVGERLLCGRKHAYTGQYICQGFVADIMQFGGRDIAAYPHGYVEDPPGWFLPNARSLRKGTRPRLRRPRCEPGIDAEPRRTRQLMARETRTRCQHCGTTAIVPVL